MTSNKPIESSNYSEYEGVAEFEGKDAEKFLEYDSKDMTAEEEASLTKAEETYKRYCKNPF